jgi:EAL and modified HD-GYP domain-containing signal transduction protein
MDKPMVDVLKDLPLSTEVCEALKDYRGNMGEALHCAIAYERGEWEEVNSRHVAAEKMPDIYIKALNWCRDFMGSLDGLRAA